MSRPSLHVHQEQELKSLLLTPRALLLSETGTGKTPTLLAYAQVSLVERERVLWVTEAGLVRQLVEESDRWLASTLPRPVEQKGAAKLADFMVCSYEWLQRRRQELRGLRFGLVIVDEAHNVGGGEIKLNATHTAVKEAVSWASRSVMVTATPISSLHGLELHALMDAGAIERLCSRQKFMDHVHCIDLDNGYGNMRRQPQSLLPSGQRLLKEALAQCVVATRLEDLGIAVPEIERREIAVPLPPERLAFYKSAGECSNGLERHRRLKDAAYEPDGLVREAVSQVRWALQTYSHVIVYAERLDVVKALMLVLKEAGIATWSITGEDRMPERHRAIAEHRASQRGVLVGSSAIETGLNLQHAQVLVSVQPSWSHKRELQREGRIRRVGSPFVQVVHVTVAPDVNLEREKAMRVARKRTLHEELLNAVPRPRQRLLGQAS